MVCCCSRSGYSHIDDVENEAPSQVNLWCGHLVACLKNDAVVFSIAHVAFIALADAAAFMNAYWSYNPEKDPVEDKNVLYPASFGVLGLCALLSVIAEGIRVSHLTRKHRKMPSPCLLASTSTAAAAGAAYWMREQALEIVSKYERNQTHIEPQRAIQMLKTDPMPDWYIATGTILFITIAYHITLRIVIYCKKKNSPYRGLDSMESGCETARINLHKC